LSTLYLIRHGQAGTRDDYDRLSELGHQQADVLGRYLSANGIGIDGIYAGGLKRQQQTAHAVREHLVNSDPFGLPVVTDSRWDEFSLRTVYVELAERLIKDSNRFAVDYETMQSELLVDPHASRGAAGRCDRAIIEAWMDDRYPGVVDVTWESFRERVRSSFSDLAQHEADKRIAVFTSATPIAIWVGMALSVSNEGILRLMAVLYNSSITTIKLRSREPMLINFNMTPHLIDPALVTYR